MISVFDNKHLKNLASGFLANILGVLATSLILVRIVAEQGEAQLSDYVYHIAVINVISSVLGAGVSNFLIRNWGDQNLSLAGQGLTTTFVLALSAALVYYLFLPDSSVIMALTLLMITAKRALTSILRVLRKFDALLRISVVEFLAILIFFVLNWQKISFSWTIVLVSAYALSSLMLYRELFTIPNFCVRPSRTTYFPHQELYIFFAIAFLQSLGLYGERFVIKYLVGEGMMTAIFQETYVYRLGLMIFTVISGLIMAYLGSSKLSAVKLYVKTYGPLILGVTLLSSTLLYILRPGLNRTLLLFDSSLSTFGHIILLSAFTVNYLLRLIKPIVIKYGRHQEIILCEFIFTFVFLISLMWLQQSVNATNYACTLLLANFASLVFFVLVLRRLKLTQH